MRTVISYGDLPHDAVAVGAAQPQQDPQRKRKRVKYVGAHWDEISTAPKQFTPAWSRDDDDAIIASPTHDSSPALEPVILPGTGVPLDSSEIWDDSFLVDVWAAAEQEYIDFHHRRSTALENESKWTRLRPSPVYHAEKSSQETPGWSEAQRLVAVTEARSARVDNPSAAPSSDDIQHPGPVPPPGAPPFPVDESLQNLIMAWYYTGYYTAMYQHHK